MDNRSYLRRITVFLIVVMTWFAFTGTVLAQTALENVRKSTVRIAWGISEDNDAWRESVRNPLTGEFNPLDLILHVGSGFIIGDDPDGEFRYVVTAWHVTDRDIVRFFPEPFTLRPDDVTLYIYRSRDDYVEAVVRHPLPGSDIAILEVAPFERGLHGYVPLELGHSGMVDVGDEVWAVGFPGAAEVVTDFTAAYHTDLSVSRGTVSRLATLDGVSSIISDISISGGFSGGPLVNEDGVVVGVISRGVDWTANGAFIPARIEQAVSIDSVTDITRSRNLPALYVGDAPPPVDPVDPEPQEEEPPAAPVDPDPPAAPPEEQAAPPEPSGGFETYFLYIGLGAAALLMVIAVVVLGKGKSKPVSAPAAPSSPPPPSQMQAPVTQKVSAPVTRAKTEPVSAPVTKGKPVQPAASIKGISGHFAGQTVELAGGQLIIGRDPRLAQLVYPQSNEEISRKHVTVRFDERTQKFVLEDSSSNGTFLSSKERLEPGKPYYLSSGERFYIADPKEVFELKAE